MTQAGEGGWTSIGVPQISIKLQVGSENIIYNKKEVVLTAAPEKIEGRIRIIK